MTTTTTPPRYLPTLTDVVVRTPIAVPLSNDSTVASEPVVFNEAQLTQRIMQRVDVVLERRLREALGKVILEHTQTLAPLLRQEIQATIQDAVAQALAQETSQSQV